MVAQGFRLILASNSPRRKELLAGIDVPFEVRIIDGIDESYPSDMPTKDIAGYISQKKALAYRDTLSDDELVITADTIVILGQEVMGKPKDEAEARRMLRELSGQTHQVITGVTLTTTQRQMSFSVETDVTFKQLTDWRHRHERQLFQCDGIARTAHIRSLESLLSCPLCLIFKSNFCFFSGKRKKVVKKFVYSIFIRTFALAHN